MATKNPWDDGPASTASTVDAAGNMTVTPAAARPNFGDVSASTSFQPAARPTPNLGVRLGNLAAGITDAMLNNVKTPLNAVNRGLVGLQNVYNDAVSAPHVAPAQFSTTSAQDALAKVRADNIAAAAPKPAANFSDVSANVTTAAKPTPVAAAAGTLPLKPGDPNTFTFSNGQTVTADAAGVAKNADQGSFNVVPASALTGDGSPAGVSAPVATAPTGRNTGSGFVGIIPMPQGAGEADRRSQLAADMSTLGRGSPSMRRALMDQYQQEVNNAAQAQRDALRLDAETNQAEANRNLEVQKINAGLADSAAQRDASLQAARIARPPNLQTSADGSMGIVGNDGSWIPVLRNGQQVRAPQAPRQTGGLTQQDILKSLDDQEKSLLGAQLGGKVSDADQATLAQIRASRDALIRGNSGGSQQQNTDGAPQAGAVVNGYRFKGGDPNSQSNWEKV